MIKPSKGTVTAIAVMLVIIAMWVTAPPISKRLLEDDVFKEPFSTIYNGLNVLFTALAFGGVIITLVFQSEQARHARREEIERSIFELFQTFTSLEFQQVKDGAFRALLTAVKNREYAEYLASRLFVVDQKRFPVSAIDTLRQLDENKQSLSDAQLEHADRADRADRLMLDNMLNFFALLAQRESSATVIKHCDFAYDWWRPVLWMIGSLQEAHYQQSELVRTYCKTQLITNTLRALDKVYDHAPIADSRAAWAYINHHPKMLAFGLDPQFAELPTK